MFYSEVEGELKSSLQVVFLPGNDCSEGIQLSTQNSGTAEVLKVILTICL